MIIDIRLQNFRSYSDASFEFNPGVNIIVGANASGKTNLLEAILVACSGTSYRARDVELISFDQPWARLDVRGERPRIVKIVRKDGDSVAKEFTIDGKKLLRLHLQKTWPIVLFEPNHLRLLSGSPERRREYLDDLLEQTTPGYGTLRRQYKRTLAQRNALLKHSPYDESQFFAWNVRLSNMGGQIAAARTELIIWFSERMQDTYNAIAGKSHTVTLHYESKCGNGDYGSAMLKLLEAHHQQDVERGHTSYGPHRDDMGIIIDGHPVDAVASRGETRTMLLSLKILELERVAEARGKRPILLLDDVFSELDGARRRALTEVIKDYQTFITTTDADVVVQYFMNNCTIVPL